MRVGGSGPAGTLRQRLWAECGSLAVFGGLLMLYEYRHVGRRRRGCPQTFELMRNVAQRDDVAPCPKCGNGETARIKFQGFAVASGTTAGSSEGGGAARPTGSGPYDDFTPENMASDLDSDVAHL